MLLVLRLTLIVSAVQVFMNVSISNLNERIEILVFCKISQELIWGFQNI
jgi:hypothetical protein